MIQPSSDSDMCLKALLRVRTCLTLARWLGPHDVRRTVDGSQGNEHLYYQIVQQPDLRGY